MVTAPKFEVHPSQVFTACQVSRKKMSIRASHDVLEMDAGMCPPVSSSSFHVGGVLQCSGVRFKTSSDLRRPDKVWMDYHGDA